MGVYNRTYSPALCFKILAPAKVDESAKVDPCLLSGTSRLHLCSNNNIALIIDRCYSIMTVERISSYNSKIQKIQR